AFSRSRLCSRNKKFALEKQTSPSQGSMYYRSERSETVVREGLVGFRHPVHFLALLHRRSAAFGGLEQLAGETLGHRLLGTLACSLAQPAHRQRHAARRPHFDRHLVVGTTDAAALDLDHRLHVG